MTTMSTVGDERAPSGHPPSVWEQAADAFTAWRDGTASADELVRLMTPVLWHVARACRLDEDTARDVIQDVWVALVRRRAEIENPRAVGSWLVTSTRRESWRLRREADLARTAVPADDAAWDAVLPASEAAEDLAAQREDHRSLWSAVASLPERCQRLLRVVAFSDRPDYAALSEHLGMPVGSIGPTRARCLTKLRAALEAGAGSTQGGVA